jgi:hypothetical protein
VTAFGRMMIELTKSIVETRFGGRVLYGDSVTGDTAIVVRIQGKITTARIDELGAPGSWKPYQCDAKVSFASPG